MKRNYIAVLASILSLTAFADITNVVDIAAMADCGTGVTNGWTVSGIDSYADKVSLRFNDSGEFVQSPDFKVNVKKVLLKFKSSSQAGRRLAFYPLLDGKYPQDAATYFNYSPNKDTYVSKEIDLTHGPVATGFKLTLQELANSATGWGISYLAIVTETPTVFTSPEKLFAGNLSAHAATVSWKHNVFVASNLVVVTTVTNKPGTMSVKSNYDFLLCQNLLANDSQEKSKELAIKYPEFSAYKVFYPALSGGQLRISTGSENGRLTHKGYADYSKLYLEVEAKRYAGDNKMEKIYAYYIDDAQHTNTIGTISIGDEFTTGRIPLAGTPGGVAINLGNLDGYKSNRRFIVDHIRFLEENGKGESVTVVVKNEVVANGDSIRLTRLQRNTTYTVTVTAIDENGKLANNSTTQTFTTAERNGGMMLRYR